MNFAVVPYTNAANQVVNVNQSQPVPPSDPGMTIDGIKHLRLQRHGIPIVVSVHPFNAQLLDGRRLVLKVRPGNPGKRSLALLAKDADIVLGAGNGSADDPRTAGGSVRVRSESGGFDVTYPLAASGWRLIGPDGGNKGYRYADRALRDGPVASVRLKPGSLKVAARGAGLAHDLAVDPSPVDLVLTIGSQRYCLRFDAGTFRASRSFASQAAPAPSTCP